MGIRQHQALFLRSRDKATGGGIAWVAQDGSQQDRILKFQWVGWRDHFTGKH